MVCLEDEGLTEDGFALALRVGGGGEGGASISTGSSSSRGVVETLSFYSILKVSQEEIIHKKRIT